MSTLQKVFGLFAVVILCVVFYTYVLLTYQLKEVSTPLEEAYNVDSQNLLQSEATPPNSAFFISTTYGFEIAASSFENGVSPRMIGVESLEGKTRNLFIINKSVEVSIIYDVDAQTYANVLANSTLRTIQRSVVTVNGKKAEYLELGNLIEHDSGMREHVYLFDRGVDTIEVRLYLHKTETPNRIISSFKFADIHGGAIDIPPAKIIAKGLELQRTDFAEPELEPTGENFSSMEKIESFAFGDLYKMVEGGGPIPCLLSIIGAYNPNDCPEPTFPDITYTSYPKQTYLLKTPDGFYNFYRPVYAFFSPQPDEYDEVMYSDVPEITWSDGTKNTSKYIEEIPKKGGFDGSSYLTINLDENVSHIVGHADDVSLNAGVDKRVDIYELANPDDTIMHYFFEYSNSTYNEITETYVSAGLKYEEWRKGHPVIFYKNAVGEYVLLFRMDSLPDQERNDQNFNRRFSSSKPGDVVQGFTVKGVRALQDSQPISKDNYKVELTGTAVVSATAEFAEFDGEYHLRLSADSLKQYPWLTYIAMRNPDSKTFESVKIASENGSTIKIQVKDPHVGVFDGSDAGGVSAIVTLVE